MRPLLELMIGESPTIQRQITDRPPWRIGVATSSRAMRLLKLARIRLPAWLWVSTAVPSVACAIAVAGRQNSGLAASMARRESPGTSSAPWIW